MPTSIQLDPLIEQRLDYLADVTGRSKASFLRELIVNGLDDLEDRYLAEHELEAVRSGESKTYSLDDLEKKLGLAA